MALLAILVGCSPPLGVREPGLEIETSPHPVDPWCQIDDPGDRVGAAVDAVDLRAVDGVDDAVGWLAAHVLTIDPLTGGAMVAWWDPTLAASETDLVSYAVTDTLWSSRALAPYDPDAARALEAGLDVVGWHGNGLQEVLFAPAGALRFEPDTPDWVHGASIGLCALPNGDTVDVRAHKMRAGDSDFPDLFVDSAVYQALAELWGRDPAVASARIVDLLDRTGADDALFWDPDARVLVDADTHDGWERYVRGVGATEVASYKLALVLYAAKLLDLRHPALAGIEGRLAEAQWTVDEAVAGGNPDEAGGYAHVIVVMPGGRTWKTGPTGEATAAAVLVASALPVDLTLPDLDGLDELGR